MTAGAVSATVLFFFGSFMSGGRLRCCYLLSMPTLCSIDYRRLSCPSQSFWTLAIDGEKGQESLPTSIFEAYWALLRGFGQASGGSWAALWGALGAS